MKDLELEQLASWVNDKKAIHIIFAFFVSIYFSQVFLVAILFFRIIKEEEYKKIIKKVSFSEVEAKYNLKSLFKSNEEEAEKIEQEEFSRFRSMESNESLGNETKSTKYTKAYTFYRTVLWFIVIFGLLGLLSTMFALQWRYISFLSSIVSPIYLIGIVITIVLSKKLYSFLVK